MHAQGRCGRSREQIKATVDRRDNPIGEYRAVFFSVKETCSHSVISVLKRRASKYILMYNKQVHHFGLCVKVCVLFLPINICIACLSFE